jgi:hypothetical protein
LNQNGVITKVAERQIGAVQDNVFVKQVLSLSDAIEQGLEITLLFTWEYFSSSD